METGLVGGEGISPPRVSEFSRCCGLWGSAGCFVLWEVRERTRVDKEKVKEGRDTHRIVKARRVRGRTPRWYVAGGRPEADTDIPFTAPAAACAASCPPLQHILPLLQ